MLRYLKNSWLWFILKIVVHLSLSLRFLCHVPHIVIHNPWDHKFSNNSVLAGMFGILLSVKGHIINEPFYCFKPLHADEAPVNQTRATRRREPHKLKQICWNSFVIICTLDKNGRLTLWEGLDSNVYSHMSHLNGCSPMGESLDSNH